MLFIPCFLSYLILHFRTYHCLGSKETTTWTTYAYSYCSVLCRESCRPCRWAVRLRGGVGPEFHGKYFADTNLYDFIDLYSVSVIAVKCAISCYMGLRYNTTLVISFMNVMPVLWHVQGRSLAEAERPGPQLQTVKDHEDFLMLGENESRKCLENKCWTVPQHQNLPRYAPDVHVCVCDMRIWWDVVREKIDRVKTAPHCNWLNAQLSTTS